MQIFSNISDLTKNYSNIVVALGTFDGVHIGHQSIIKKAIKLAKEIDGTSAVFTFSNHPLEIICPSKCPLTIGDNYDKELWMRELGVDILVDIPFTANFLKLSPIDFLTLLKTNLNPKYIVVGPNYSFGYKGQGNSKLLIELGKNFGFKAEIQPEVYIENKLVSSTLIRSLIVKGDIASANKLLGKRFKLGGQVIQGDQRGRELGFPTANMEIKKGRVIPSNGVYAVDVIFKNKLYHAIANIGTNPTFNGSVRHIEVHILDFNMNIYDEIIEIQFIKKIRNEKQFESKNKLISQIKLDIQAAFKNF
ncbi:bifunctional riboflavin kinase/FAD synthetase [Anaerosinus massiliensis]|uniref:bifunctional riboflavin kinase/FAD synthetase n=1 Tax=Massilibacillus massiliensis TaxID=1806837 RepID=UPI000A64307A|nr:bifunctional riboflavin kinase/FAD synthetase [Massilibacillus massiliensis]